MQSALERAASLLSVDASALVQLECIFGLRHSYVRSWLINQMVLPVVVGALVLLWYTCKRARGDEQASASAYNVAFLAVFLLCARPPCTLHGPLAPQRSSTSILFGTYGLRMAYVACAQ